jgi:hypothetical protein
MPPRHHLYDLNASQLVSHLSVCRLRGNSQSPLQNRSQTFYSSSESVQANGVVFDDASFADVTAYASRPVLCCSMGLTADSSRQCLDTDGCEINTCNNSIGRGGTPNVAPSVTSTSTGLVPTSTDVKQIPVALTEAVPLGSVSLVTAMLATSQPITFASTSLAATLIPSAPAMQQM